VITCARRDGATETGTVAWVDASRNNGFIRPDGGGGDLFVDRWDAATGVVGAAVAFETRHVARGRAVAANVVLRAGAADDRNRVPPAAGWRAGR
jgi:cold shock CspA family protein